MENPKLANKHGLLYWTVAVLLLNREYFTWTCFMRVFGLEKYFVLFLIILRHNSVIPGFAYCSSVPFFF